MDSNGTTSTPALRVSTSKDILGPLAAGFYALFTLLPDSSSLVVSWPWVFVWQVALLLPWLWLLRHGWIQKQFIGLGYGLDYGVILAVVGLMGSTLLAAFPQQARWYSWAAFCALAALYALNAWCANPKQRLKLLKAQGGLSIAFIVISLSLWVNQTLLPELDRLNNLRAAGLDLPYDFSVLELRNWAPIGHQNYVAGYLVLCLPLLLELSVLSKAKERWVWVAGSVLGLVDLYTTSSRGGWLGMALVVASGGLLLLKHPRLSLRVRWMIGAGLLTGLCGILFANNRLRSLFFSTAPLDGVGGETAFRAITNATGWAMGLAHPYFGAGLGSVPLLYQKYRPAWAGREAELVYQLHGTPAQVWAELGGLGIALSLGMTGWLGYWGVRLWRSQSVALESDRILSWSLLSGLAGYGVVSITDYQLDIVCISGTLIVYGVSLISLLRQYVPTHLDAHAVKTSRIVWLCCGLVGLLIAVGLWLAPIHRAWQLSSLGFNALSQKQIEPFKNYLAQAHQLAPWEPYYSYQLGWNLSTATSEDQQVNQSRLSQGLEFFGRNVKVSPNQESGTSSLGWLQLFSRQPSLATASFLQSTHLVPAKRGGFHSLGISLLGQGKVDLGVQAIALEIVRDPLWLTSPLWRSAQYAPIYPRVEAAVIETYQKLLSVRPLQSRTWEIYLHQCLGGVYWWQGKVTEAETEWRKDATVLGQAVLAISKNNTPSTEIPILRAWLEPQNRGQWITKALLQTNKAVPNPKDVQAIQAGMEQSKSLDQWIKQNAPTQQYPRERAGFGVLSRHIDGPAPTDFFPVVENVAMTQFFAELLPSPSYSPDLDNALQPLRDKLWASIVPATKGKP